jgi:carbonic anhydrase
MSDAAHKWERMVERHAEVALTIPHDVGGPPPHRPDVAILACSDARVPPSLVFGQEPGTSFVVRVAGNSATPDAVASLAYAVEVLGVDLVVVLGHTGCGAVNAALAPSVDPTFNPILTPIDEMLATCSTCGDADAAVAANVQYNVGRLERDRGPLGAAIAQGRVTVRGAVHDLTTGCLIELDRPTASHRSPSTHQPLSTHQPSSTRPTSLRSAS